MFDMLLNITQGFGLHADSNPHEGDCMRANSDSHGQI